MKIEAVDFFYLSMPEITTEGDGSQDALLVRVSAGGLVGWGECEASPLVSIAAYVAPMSHGACRPVRASVEGREVTSPADIEAIARDITRNSMDLLQAPHTWSGVEMALWDLVGKACGEPVWRLLGYSKAAKKLPYASVLFGDTPQQTLDAAKAIRASNYRAAKFGWGPIGRESVREDADQFAAAREGLGADGMLLIDAGQIWGDDVEAAAARLPSLEAVKALWLEEPFHGSAYEAYAALAARSGSVRLAGGEAAHNVFMARHTIDYGRVGFCADRLRPHRGHRAREGGRRLRLETGGYLRKPHLHLAPGVIGVPAALCRTHRSCDLRISCGAQSAGARDRRQSIAAGCRWRDCDPRSAWSWRRSRCERDREISGRRSY